MKRIFIIQTGMGSSAELSSLCTEIIPEANVIQIIDDGILQEAKFLPTGLLLCFDVRPKLRKFGSKSRYL